MPVSVSPVPGTDILRVLMLGTALCALAPATGFAQPADPGPATGAVQHVFDIPAGPLAAALRRFSVETGSQLLFETRIVADQRSRAVQGEMPADAALEALLAGSGLVVRRVDARTYAIGRTSAANGNARPAPAPGRILLSAQRNSGSAARETELFDLVDPREVIIVTGSRFRRSGQAAVTPVQVVGRASLESSGAVEIGEMLAFQSPASLEFSSASTHLSAQNAGLSSIGLRGLGTTRTLVLIDGRRSVSNSGNASRFGSDTIPAEFVERVEISTGGASALYGSDAIAGVVNFVLRDDLDGGRAMAQSGVTQDGGGSYNAISLTRGQVFAGARGHVMANISWDRTDRIGATDRDWATASVALSADGETLESDLSSYTDGGRFIGSDFWYDDDGLHENFDVETDGYDSRSEATISVPRERFQLGLKGRYAWSSGVSAYLTALYSQSETSSSREPQTAYYGQRFGADNETIGRIPLDYPLMPEPIREAALAEGVSGVTWRRRFSELGPESREIDRQTARVWLGLQGEASGWNWDIALGHGAYRQDQMRSGELNFARIRDALEIEADPASPGGYRCADAEARSAGCVPLDMFGVGAVSDAAADYIRAVDRLEVEIDQWTLGGVATGVLSFSGREVPLAVGFELREDSQVTRGDAAAQQRETGYVGVPDMDASARAAEIFAESWVTLVENRPMARRLDATAALRLAHYDIAQVDTVGSYRLGLSWAIDETWQVRTQLSRAQRAPSLTELYSGERGDYDSVSDPCDGVEAGTPGTLADNCRTVPGIAEAIAEDGVYEQSVSSVYAPNSGNPDLREERSDTVTIGAVFTPARIPGLSVSIDAYDIRVSGAISSLSSQVMLEECYGAALALSENAYCRDIVRAPNGQLRQLLNTVNNLNEIRSSGVDVVVAHAFSRPPGRVLAGDWDVRVLYGYTDALEQVFERSDGSVRRNVWAGEVGAPPHRWTARLGWSRDNWRLQWRVRYEGAAVDSHSRAEASNAADMLYVNVDPWMRHDLYAHYTFGEARQWRLFGGINNVFHDYGPFLPSGTESGDRRNFNAGYDVNGRAAYLGIRAAW